MPVTKPLHRRFSFIHSPLPPCYICLAALIGFGAFFFFYSQAVHRNWDFTVYYIAANAVHEQIPVYDPKSLHTYAESKDGLEYGGLPYLYLPPLTRVLYPFTWLSYFNAVFLWVLLKCIALEMTVFLVLSLMRRPPTVLSLVILHGAALLYRPFNEDMNTGNMAIFESTAILLFFYFWRKLHYCKSAFFLLIASLTKGLPLLFALYPYFLKERKLIAPIVGASAFLAFFLFLDLNTTGQWWAFYQSPDWSMFWDELVQSYYNFSSTTVITRTFSETYLRKPVFDIPWLPVILTPIFSLLVFGLLGLSIHKRSQISTFQPTEIQSISILLSGYLLLLPRLAGYSFSWTFLPLCYVLHTSYTCKSYLPGFLGVLAVFLFQFPISPEHVPDGLPQLLIDKSFFAHCLIFISACLFTLRPNET
jgi:hypothetical protein